MPTASAADEAAVAAAGSTHGSLGVLFDPQAETYAAYRPGYPEKVFSTIYQFANLPAARELAVDVGCGTGQVAVGLAEVFTAVIGLDSSSAQVQHAAARPNITYRQAPAEATGLPACCADLVTAAQCLHWFDAPTFYAECRRILKPSGALAVFGYMPMAIYFPDSKEAGEVLRQLHMSTHHYFNPKRQRYLLQHYAGQEPTAEDFGVVQCTVVDMERRMSVEQLVGWVRSMSGWARYVAEHGQESMDDVLAALQADLLAALGVSNATTPVTSVWPLTMILAKQPRPV